MAVSIWILVLLCLVRFDLLEAGESCDKFELLTCGDSQLGHKWMFCRPQTAGVTRIKSIHLDVRFHNRYCRRDEIAENFGMTSGRDLIWVVNYCFGTFFVCLDTDPVVITQSTEDPIPAGFYTSMDWSQGNIHTTTEEEIARGPAGGNAEGETTVGFRTMGEAYTAITKMRTPGSYAVDEKSSETKDKPKKEKQTNTSGDDAANEDLYMMDPELKIWIMASIITGSLILIALIIMIGCLTMRCEPFNRSESEDPEQYSRQEKHSTSTIMTSDFDTDQSIYDCINDVTLDMQINSEQTIKCDTNVESPYHTYRVLNDVKQSIDSDYLSAGVDKDDPNVNIYSRIDQDNNYDHIVSKMRQPVSDNTTYCKLYDFKQCPEDVKEKAIYKAVKERLEQTDAARKEIIE